MPRPDPFARLWKRGRRAKLAALLGFMFALAAAQLVLVDGLGLSFWRYAVSGGPVMEEAFKAAALVWLGAVSLQRGAVRWWTGKRGWVAAGALLGLSVGLWEMFVEYSPGLHRVIPAFNHVIWTAAVAGGIWLFLRTKDPVKLMVPFLCAVVSHMIWNYHAYLEAVLGGEVLLGIVAIIIGVLGVVWVWRSE